MVKSSTERMMVFMNEEQRHIALKDLSDCTLNIEYNETERKNHSYEIDLHTHKNLEIYINLSGDISFLVENRLYPMTRGDIIIARPGELHHCVYKSDSLHRFFWLLIDIDNPILDFFKNNNANFISPSKEIREEIIDCCFNLVKENSSLETTYMYFRFMSLIKESINSNSEKDNNIPQDLKNILNYIDSHLSENLQIKSISKALYLSNSTIERRFSEYLNIKPTEFIRKRKMVLAVEQLRNGETVLNTALSCGYTDNSHFIKLFKEYYGITPYKFKKTFR